ncbi:MAG TPA: hypothetical protein VMV57_08990 [Terracidiphilus sp.]|nr:hypothetical protein [Terracidiphilus sp.]
MSPDYADQEPAENATDGLVHAAWHSLLWLVVGNGIGVMLAILLLLPGLNLWLGEWTYGRWIVVHMNLALYGWSSLPMVAFLFAVYGADRGATARWCRPALWAWSAALVVGAYAWLSGNSSGKLFLDWSGFARVAFPLAIAGLWILLTVSLARKWSAPENAATRVRAAKVVGLLLLAAVPAALYIASSPALYPPVNPATGGPTGASQLESSLAVVAILLLLPFGLARRKAARAWAVPAAWWVLAAQSVLCVALGRGNTSHHDPLQYLSLGTLLVWIPLTPAYYAAFAWRTETRGWRQAFLCWWSGLLLTGWILFLPGVLDRFKFTDALVGHSFTAMAGFLSALLIFVMVQLMGSDGWIFTRGWSFHLWNWSVLAYIGLMSIAGWMEGPHPEFTITLGTARNTLYALRLLTGVLMLVASLEWFQDAWLLLRERESGTGQTVQEATA